MRRLKLTECENIGPLTHGLKEEETYCKLLICPFIMQCAHVIEH